MGQFNPEKKEMEEILGCYMLVFKFVRMDVLVNGTIILVARVHDPYQSIIIVVYNPAI